MRQIINILFLFLGIFLGVGGAFSYAITLTDQISDWQSSGYSVDVYDCPTYVPDTIAVASYEWQPGSYSYFYASAPCLTCTSSSSVFTQSQYDNFINTSSMYCARLVPTVQNGVQDPNEDGIDCGGDTGIDCVNRCPDGYYYHDGFCISEEPTGVSPAEVQPDWWEDEWGEWVSEESPTYTTIPALSASPDSDLTIDDFDTDSSTQQAASSSVPQSQSVTDSSTTYDFSIVSNDDGSSTETLTETTTISQSDGTKSDIVTSTSTTTSPDGSSTVVTETSNITYNTSTGTYEVNTTTQTDTYDADGNLVSSSSSDLKASEDGLYGQEVSEAEEGAGLGFDTDGDGKGDGIQRMTVSDVNFEPLRLSANNLMSRFPFSLITRADMLLDTWIVTPQSPEINFSLPIIRSDPFVMDLSLLDPLAAFLRACLAFTAVVSGMYMIIKTWV
ncbi:hypothetical protein HTZ97_13680 [Desulfuromonas acetoxidans]|uniref:hypothetical protein n=1 Tax=Desulfuromonas acetoxidans TaxID=891 RepID=UPI00159334AB|nr:hypothetical protein [Desulfuromonas acetoxidans]MBF0644879.1 hypothetical protein [Desulfuromonas acetoxidans]NVD25396.1 hypothetical protein [Desulfuromonas acetoxidans]NVE17503.1 hypothetical protein [Desulfuromonas acetoxidans]